MCSVIIRYDLPRAAAELKLIFKLNLDDRCVAVELILVDLYPKRAVVVAHAGIAVLERLV